MKRRGFLKSCVAIAACGVSVSGEVVPDDDGWFPFPVTDTVFSAKARIFENEDDAFIYLAQLIQEMYAKEMMKRLDQQIVMKDSGWRDDASIV